MKDGAGTLLNTSQHQFFKPKLKLKKSGNFYFKKINHRFSVKSGPT